METISEAGRFFRGITRSGMAFAGRLESVLLPGVCENCQSPAIGKTSLCSGCVREVGRLAKAFCRSERSEENGDIALITRLPWCGPVRSLIHGFKYSGRRRCLRTLMGMGSREAMKREAELLPLRRTLWVPVPPHPLRKRERGQDATGLLAHLWASLHGGAVAVEALRRQHYTRPQASLSAEERHTNLAGCLVPGSDADKLAGFDTVVVCDDVMTTGSTLEVCTEVLRGMTDARVVWCVLARAPKLGAGGTAKSWDALAGFLA